MKKLTLLCVLALAASAAWAAKSIEREMICPICGREFYAILDVPDPDYEMRLDMKPLGAVPGPWHIPDCPGCGFIIYTAGIPKAELARCGAFVESDEYRRGARRATYYRTGLLHGMLGGADFTLAQDFLKASWQEESEPDKLKEDLELALRYFTACAASCGGDEQENSRLMAGEMLRRLGRFDEAKAHFSGLKAEKGFQGNFYADIVDFQLKLCEKKDLSVHNMEEVKAEKMPPAARLKWRLGKWAAAFLRGAGLKK